MTRGFLVVIGVLVLVIILIAAVVLSGVLALIFDPDTEAVVAAPFRA
jgi:hypothetical protein